MPAARCKAFFVGTKTADQTARERAAKSAAQGDRVSYRGEHERQPEPRCWEASAEVPEAFMSCLPGDTEH